MSSNNHFDAPLVMIHGLFGWGSKRPFFGLVPSYFPLDELQEAWHGGPVIAIDVGVGSSDHDRACEAFAQLFGTETDYGADHSSKCGHTRFGPDYTGKPLLARWGPAHPVHLIGHSFGGNTALMLLKLLQEDFWCLGTNSDWVASITTICSPMHGASLPFAMGLMEQPCTSSGSPIRPWSFVYLVNFSCALVFYLQLWCPLLDKIYGFRMRQWRTQTSIPDWLFGRNAYWISGDNMLSEATPKRCRERLCTGLEHLAKVHLIAVVGDAIEPLEPRAAAGILARRAGFFAVLGAVLMFVIRRARRKLRLMSTITHQRLMLKASCLGVLCTLASTVVARVMKPQIAFAPRHLVVRCIHSTCVRPVMRLTSYFVAQAAASLPRGSGLLVGGGDVLGNDGLIDISSQTGLDIPLVQSPHRRMGGCTPKSIMSSNSVASMAMSAARPLAMSRTYSEVVIGDATRPRPVCVEKGKWLMLRVPHADHSLGTAYSVHSSAMYNNLLSLLAQIKQ